jgi:cysteine synthase A
VQTFIADPPGSGHFNYVTKGEFTVTEGSSYTEGIGIARLTANFAAAKLDGAIFVTDAETAQMVQYLIENEGLVVGPSAALNVVAAVKVGRILKAQRNADVNEVPTVVTVICDSGERYQRKVFDTQWLSEKGLYFQNVSNELEWIL